MMIGMKIEGRRRFNSTFVRGSKTEYETKKIERAALYMPVDSLRSVSRWAILAFPMFVLSRKDSRYRIHSYSDQRFRRVRKIGAYPWNQRQIQLPEEFAILEVLSAHAPRKWLFVAFLEGLQLRLSPRGSSAHLDLVADPRHMHEGPPNWLQLPSRRCSCRSRA